VCQECDTQTKISANSAFEFEHLVHFLQFSPSIPLKEISPVLPRPNPNEDFDVPPLPQPLHLSREWRPLQTSTLTNFHSIMPNTRVNGGQKWQQQMNGHANTGNIMVRSIYFFRCENAEFSFNYFSP
jgi:hypothetical protein